LRRCCRWSLALRCSLHFSLCFSLPISLSLFLSLYISLTLYFSLSLFLALSFSLSSYPSRALSLSLSIYLSLSLSLGPGVRREGRVGRGGLSDGGSRETLRSTFSRMTWHGALHFEEVCACRCRENMAHMRPSRPDSGLGFPGKVLETFQVVPVPLGSGLSGLVTGVGVVKLRASSNQPCTLNRAHQDGNLSASDPLSVLHLELILAILDQGD